MTNPLAPTTPVPLNPDQPLRYRDLASNTTYTSPGLEYLTDEQSLPARVRGALRLVPPDERVRHTAAQAAVGQKIAGKAHPGGHIVAVSLGGFASGPNLLPQNNNFNISAYARLEHGWRRALRDGADVAVDIALTLDDDPQVPQFWIVSYWEDGDEWEHVFVNDAHAQ